MTQESYKRKLTAILSADVKKEMGVRSGLFSWHDLP